MGIQQFQFALRAEEREQFAQFADSGKPDFGALKQMFELLKFFGVAAGKARDGLNGFQSIFGDAFLLHLFHHFFPANFIELIERHGKLGELLWNAGNLGHSAKYFTVVEEDVHR